MGGSLCTNCVTPRREIVAGRTICTICRLAIRRTSRAERRLERRFRPVMDILDLEMAHIERSLSGGAQR